MSQWGQPQGFQYPMQTGFPQGNPQFQQNQQFQPQMGQQQPGQQQFQQSPSGFQQGGFGGQPGGLRPQATGFPMQNQPGFQQAQPTGFPGGQQMMQSQPTGFVGGNFGQQGGPAPPPVPPLPTQFQGQNQGPGMMGGLQQPQQPNRFLSASPGLGGSGLVPQATGFPGRASAGLVPQMTGFIDPRLQMMQQSFMPMNTSAPYTPGGMLQLPPSQNLQQSFQQYNQEQRGQSTQQISWALSKNEKKNYDKIFRSWDASGSGFISGQAALEVFGQSGLPQNELAKIWSAASRFAV
jgi:actin cytoskeleton-regulatory complex protein PAN1